MLGKQKKDFISKETILKNVKNYTKLLNRQCKNDINIDTKDALFGFCSALNEAIKRENVDGANIYKEICKNLMKPIGYFEFFAQTYNQQFEKLKNDRIYGNYFFKGEECAYNIDFDDIYEFMSSSTVGSEPPEGGYCIYEDISSKEQLIKTIYLSNRAAKIVPRIDDIFMDEAVSIYLKNTKKEDNQVLHEKLRYLYEKILERTTLNVDFINNLAKFKRVSASYYQNPVNIESYSSTDVYKEVEKVLKYEIEKAFNDPQITCKGLTRDLDKSAIELTPELLYKHSVLVEMSNNFYSIKDFNIIKLIEEYLYDIKNIKEKYAGNEELMEKMLNEYKSNLRITYDGDANRMSENKRYSSVVNIAHKGYISPLSFHFSLFDIPKIEEKTGENLEYGHFDTMSFKKDDRYINFNYDFHFSNNLFFKYSHYQSEIIEDVAKKIASDEERDIRENRSAILRIERNQKNSAALQFLEFQKRMLNSLQDFNLTQCVPAVQMAEKLSKYRKKFSGVVR